MNFELFVVTMMVLATLLIIFIRADHSYPVARSTVTRCDFIVASTWQGAKKGYVFKSGAQGVGYYLDDRAELTKDVTNPSVKGGRVNR